jgi:carbonic anhydrase/acetyltransferase-like protein (isoleucine patch superfamily)
VREGATIGASCTIGNDLVVGRFAMVGMGSLVTRSILDFHLALGHPAASVGCVCRCGLVLRRWSEDAVAETRCAACGLAYGIDGRAVRELGPPA